MHCIPTTDHTVGTVLFSLDSWQLKIVILTFSRIKWVFLCCCWCFEFVPSEFCKIHCRNLSNNFYSKLVRYCRSLQNSSIALGKFGFGLGTEIYMVHTVQSNSVKIETNLQKVFLLPINVAKSLFLRFIACGKVRGSQ